MKIYTINYIPTDYLFANISFHRFIMKRVILSPANPRLLPPLSCHLNATWRIQRNNSIFVPGLLTHCGRDTGC